RLVIASRTDPPLGLGTLRARAELTELRAAPLRFTEAEAESLLIERLGLPLTVEEVARLTARTEGWPAGLYLAALSLQGREDVSAFVDSFSGQSRHLVDYLSAEVLDRLPEATRAFLLETSVLDTLSVSLCDAVTERTDAAIHLTELQRTNQFLIALDERGEWYRYHHLFQELLQLELTRTAPDRVATLHARAAGWYRRAGEPIGAMRHALAEPDHALAGEIFIENAESLQATGRFATVEGWMDQFPESVVAANPPLALAVAWVAALAYRPKREVERWLALAAATDQQPGPFIVGSHTLRSGAALARAFSLLDDVGGAVQAGEEAIQVEADPARHTYLLARASLGQALYFAGRVAEARPLLEAALSAPLAHEQVSSVTRFLAILAMVHLDLGEIGRAEDLAHRSTELRERSGLTEHPSHWTTSLALSMVLARQGRFAEAEVVLAEGVEPRLPTLSEWRIPYAHALLVLAPVRFARGHAQAAEALLDEARAAIAACPDPGMLPALLTTTERSLHRLPRRATGLHEDLSDGELRVLRLLATDLNQREIGRELYLSVNTVKTHTRNIYGKLGATSRQEAIARARTLGLIA
ncbi:MAG: LuxR C-terminal-related transcriptional regulator, partial [Dehalococcoidia bacterium]